MRANIYSFSQFTVQSTAKRCFAFFFVRSVRFVFKFPFLLFQVNGSRAITAATAILLGRHFGTSPELWMNLQTAHDLAVAREVLGCVAA